MTGNKKLFVILCHSIKYEVKLGNNNKVDVIGKGKISVLKKNVEKIFIPNESNFSRAMLL